MKILALDTETTGLPPKHVPATSPDEWPYIVQFSYVVFETDDDTALEVDCILRVPVDITTTFIHGITKEASDRGVDFGEVFHQFYAAMTSADIVVGHNLDFDMQLVVAECTRRRLSFEFPSVRFCTMRESKERVGLLNASGYFKYPKLSELYEHLFHVAPVNLHNALADAYMCLRCFFVLVLKRDNEVLRLKCE